MAVGISSASTSRRVGLFRALLVAHGQMMWNRTRRGVGRRGVFGLVVVLLILLTGALPLFFAFGVLGFLFGKGVDNPLVPALMGFVLMVVPVFAGVIGGMLGGARQLTWEAYRSFPAPFRTLFFAETFACLGDLVVLGYACMMGCLGVTFVWQLPSSLPLIALLVGQLVLWVIFLQHMVGSLAVSAVRRLRRAMVLLVVVAWAGVSALAEAAREIQLDVPGHQVARLREVWHQIRPLVDALPQVLAVRGIAEAEDARFAKAVALELPMMLATALLGAVSYLILRRETRSEVVLDASEARPERARTGKAVAPRWAMARLHLHHVSASLQGRFGLVVPLITIVLVKGPLGAAGIGPKLSLPGGVIYLAMAGTQFHFNQFGLDGQGVKTLLLLPVPTRDLLLGKTYALLAYSAVQNAFLLALMLFFLSPTPADTVAALVLGACLTVAHVGQGHWLSAMYPRPLVMHRMNATGLSAANLLPLGVGLVNASVFGGVYALTSLLTPEARIDVLLSLLVATIAAYWLVLPRAESFVMARRENLVEILG